MAGKVCMLGSVTHLQHFTSIFLLMLMMESQIQSMSGEHSTTELHPWAYEYFKYNSLYQKFPKNVKSNTSVGIAVTRAVWNSWLCWLILFIHLTVSKSPGKQASGDGGKMNLRWRHQCLVGTLNMEKESWAAALLSAFWLWMAGCF